MSPFHNTWISKSNHRGNPCLFCNWPRIFPERSLIQFWNNKSSIQNSCSNNSICNLPVAETEGLALIAEYDYRVFQQQLSYTVMYYGDMHSNQKNRCAGCSKQFSWTLCLKPSTTRRIRDIFHPWKQTIGLSIK